MLSGEEVTNQKKRANDLINDLKERLSRKENEMRSMQQIGKSLSSELNREKLLLLIMDEVTRLMDAERGTLFIVDDEMGELWSKIAQKSEIKEIRLKIGVGIAGHVAKTGDIINIPDAYEDKRFDPTTDKKTGYKTRSILCMPILEPVKNEKERGAVIGVLQILNKKSGYFSEEDEDLLTSLASQISISLVNSRLYGILEERVNELNLLFKLEEDLNRAFELDELLSNLVINITDSLNAESGLMLLADQEGITFPIRYAKNLDIEKIKNAEITAEKGIIGKVLKSGKSYICNNAAEDPIVNKDLEKYFDLKIRNALCTPLLLGDRVIGIFELMNKFGDNSYFSNNDEKIMESVAGQIARGIDNYHLKEEKVKADRLAAIGNMMSTIVHDLRTPMNNIYGFVDLMLEENDMKTRKEYADIVNEQIKILTNMTTDVLDFAKGKTTILPAKFAVDKLVKKFATLFENDIKQKGFKFTWKVNTSSMIYIDTEKIIRVFMNIMKNALEAMEKGGTFSIEAEEKDGEILFCLKDTGSGIPPEIRDKLFDSFVTSGKEGGTGLGLAIVKKVIEEHKGRIEVESDQGKGTTFKLYFPKL